MTTDRDFLISRITTAEDFAVVRGELPGYLNPEVLFRFWRMTALWGDDVTYGDVEWCVTDFGDTGPLCKLMDQRAVAGVGVMALYPSGRSVITSSGFIHLKNGVFLLYEGIPPEVLLTIEDMLRFVEHIEEKARSLGGWDGKTLFCKPISTWR